MSSEKKELTDKDLALYLGCQIQVETYLKENDARLETMNTHALHMIWSEFPHWKNAKPILRPESDMTESEAIVIVEKLRKILPDADCWDDDMILDQWDDRPFYTYLNKYVEHSISDLQYAKGHPGIWRFMLSQHFDLFGWIDAGLAIDATTLNPNPYRDS